MRAFRRRMRIHVHGTGVPACIPSFHDMPAGKGVWGSQSHVMWVESGLPVEAVRSRRVRATVFHSLLSVLHLRRRLTMTPLPGLLPPKEEHLKVALVRNIEASQWLEPTPIQMQAIPAIAAGRVSGAGNLLT